MSRQLVIILLLVLLFLTLFCPTATATEPETEPEPTYDWDPYVLTGYKQNDGRETFYYDNSNAPVWADPAAISGGVEFWNPITPNLQLTYGGLTGTHPHMCQGGSGDGISTIAWGPTSGAGAGVIGVACWSSTGECDILLGTNSQSLDTKTILAHEVGHCIGLSHSQDMSAVMWFVYSHPMTAPAADDRAGICNLYGCPEQAPPPRKTFRLFIPFVARGN